MGYEHNYGRWLHSWSKDKEIKLLKMALRLVYVTWWRLLQRNSLVFKPKITYDPCYWRAANKRLRDYEATERVRKLIEKGTISSEPAQD